MGSWAERRGVIGPVVPFRPGGRNHCYQNESGRPPALAQHPRVAHLAGVRGPCRPVGQGSSTPARVATQEKNEGGPPGGSHPWRTRPVVQGLIATGTVEGDGPSCPRTDGGGEMT